MIGFIKKFLFENTKEKQVIAKNTFWLFASEITARLLKMGLVIYSARVLGTDGWGVFSYALSIASLLMLFSDIGLSNLITREATQKNEGYVTFISTALTLKTIILILSILAVAFIGPAISHIPEARTLFPAVAAIFLFDAIRDIGFAINRVYEKMEREMIVKAIMNTVILLLGIVLLKMNPIPASVAWAYAVGSAVGTVILAVMLWSNLRQFTAKASKKLFKPIIKTALPLAVVTLIGSIMANTDVFMLGIWRDTTEIGLYASMQRIQQFIFIIPGMISTAVFPLTLRLAETDAKKFGSLLGKAVTLSLLAGIPITIGGILLAKPIIILLFGVGYVSAVPILQILLLTFLFFFPLLFLSNAIFACNRQRSLAYAYIFGVIGNVALNALLIPTFGAVGSAFATLASTAIIMCIVWRKMKLTHDFEVVPRLKRITLSSIVMACAILILDYFAIGLIPTILVASIVYFGVLLLLKEPLIREMKNIA